MASEVVTVLLALIGIGIIVVGIMILMQLSQSQNQGVVAYPSDYQWRGHYYSHLPIRPIMSSL